MKKIFVLFILLEIGVILISIYVGFIFVNYHLCCDRNFIMYESSLEQNLSIIICKDIESLAEYQILPYEEAYFSRGILIGCKKFVPENGTFYILNRSDYMSGELERSSERLYLERIYNTDNYSLYCDYKQILQFCEIIGEKE